MTFSVHMADGSVHDVPDAEDGRLELSNCGDLLFYNEDGEIILAVSSGEWLKAHYEDDA